MLNVTVCVKFPTNWNSQADSGLGRKNQRFWWLTSRLMTDFPANSSFCVLNALLLSLSCRSLFFNLIKAARKNLEVHCYRVCWYGNKQTALWIWTLILPFCPGVILGKSLLYLNIPFIICDITTLMTTWWAYMMRNRWGFVWHQYKLS